MHLDLTTDPRAPALWASLHEHLLRVAELLDGPDAPEELLRSKYAAHLAGSSNWPAERIAEFLADKRQLVRSIRDAGYRPDPLRPILVGLVFPARRALMILDGTHRACTLKLLGHQQIPAWLVL
jgi:hypothetical protein